MSNILTVKRFQHVNTNFKIFKNYQIEKVFDKRKFWSQQSLSQRDFTRTQKFENYKVRLSGVDKSGRSKLGFNRRAKAIKYVTNIWINILWIIVWIIVYDRNLRANPENTRSLIWTKSLRSFECKIIGQIWFIFADCISSVEVSFGTYPF